MSWCNREKCRGIVRVICRVKEGFRKVRDKIERKKLKKKRKEG